MIIGLEVARTRDRLISAEPVRPSDDDRHNGPDEESCHQRRGRALGPGSDSGIGADGLSGARPGGLHAGPAHELLQIVSLPLDATESSTVVGDRDELTHMIEHTAWVGAAAR